MASTSFASSVGAPLGAASNSATAGSTMATVSTVASFIHRVAAAAPTPTPEPTSFWSSMGFAAAGGQVMDLFERGGPFMWPILFASFVGVVYLFDRLVCLSVDARATRRMLKALEALACRTDVSPAQIEARSQEFQRSPVATMAAAGLEKYQAGEMHGIDSAVERAGHSELGRLERGLPALASVSNIAPLIGFLGTVWGILLAFHIIGLKKVVNPQDISAGISQALIMSAAGLSVAIPVSGAYNYFATRVSRIAVMMHEGAYLLSMLFSMMSGELEGPDETFAADKCELPPPEKDQK
ncbi:MAG: MotA/TolQ/ExbB proton channel family protein [Candidatus Coatesbacteria bacterium]|nr:MotA/TolQ/ExbB proton channel family protein [Candidatus Coatesbacteria bacterium]